jgi:putative MATE family efflux protein
MIFLAYGTTAAVSRLLGAGRHAEAAHQAVQSLWIAAITGVVSGIGIWVFATPLLRILGGDGDVLGYAHTYLVISAAGMPALLLSLAAVGYLRGLQDTVRPLIVALVTATGNLVLELILVFGFDYGIGASALSTVIAQWVGTLLYLRWIGIAVRSHNVSLRPELASIGRQAVVAGDLFLRTAALRGSFTVATAVAARLGEPELAAHEVAFGIWMLCALALDAVAIAGQAMMGRFLGANDTDGARRVGRRMLQWGITTGTAAAIAILVLRPVIPDIFSNDPAVISLTGFLLLHLALMQPINGVVFVLDGVLIGAGDMRFLAWAMVAAAAVFVPLATLVAQRSAGIGWLWGCIWVLMAVRVAGLVWRFRSERWLVTDAALV